MIVVSMIENLGYLRVQIVIENHNKNITHN